MRALILNRAALAALGWSTVWLLACSSVQERSEVVSSELGPGIWARAGTTDIRAETVAKVSSAQNLSLAQAGELAIRDALLQLGAEREGLEETLDVRASIRARLARANLAKLASELSQLPPTDHEVDVATEGHFLELDRPEGFRVIHALARFPAKPDPTQKQAAWSLAQQVAKVVAGAKDAGEFEKRARETKAEGIELRIESLDPVAADGRVLRPSGGELVKPFAAAAARLSSPGSQSPIVETEFGYHILMLLERTPEKRVSLEERRAILRDEIMTTRIHEASSDLLERLRKQSSVQVERSAATLMQSLQVLTP